MHPLPAWPYGRNVCNLIKATIGKTSDVALAQVRFVRTTLLVRCNTKNLATAAVGQNSHCQLSDCIGSTTLRSGQTCEQIGNAYAIAQ
jgi:hypothetical protein